MFNKFLRFDVFKLNYFMVIIQIYFIDLDRIAITLFESMI